MFERFTDPARRIIVIAQNESRELHHQYIGTEHILLALIRETDLIDGITIEGAREWVGKFVGEGQSEHHGHIPFTPAAKKVLELSLREALMLNHNYIAPEHLVLGLIREGEGTAIQILIDQKIDREALRKRMAEKLPVSNPEGSGSDITRAAEQLRYVEQQHRRITQQALDMGWAIKLLSRSCSKLTHDECGDPWAKDCECECHA